MREPWLTKGLLKCYKEDSWLHAELFFVLVSIWFPGHHMVWCQCRSYVVSRCKPSSVHLETKSCPHGYHMVSKWKPCGVQMDTIASICGHHVVSRWTLCGFQMDTSWFTCGCYIASTLKPYMCGVHVETMWCQCGNHVMSMWKKISVHLETMWCTCGYQFLANFHHFHVISFAIRSQKITNLWKPVTSLIMVQFSIWKKFWKALDLFYQLV